MASSKVMASTPPSNPDLPRQSSTHFIDHSKSFGSINMDEILNNIYGDADAFPASVNDNGGDGCGGGVPLQKNEGNKTVDEVWKEIVAGREPEMTLEDFLTKAGAVSEEEVRIPVMQPPSLVFAPDSMMTAVQFQAAPPLLQNGPDGLGGGRGGGVGRGKRRAVEEPPMDKATQQKQKRMIKNRESAARSRERKQAYTVELEALVTQLEEENAKLLREEAEESKKRFKLLMENLIPVEEKRRPPRKLTLRRSNSMCW